MDWFMGKGRRKDKDSPTPPNADGKQYLEENCLKERVIDADFVKLVQLPPSLDSDEWLATHTISFFNHVNLMYGVVSEYCTSESCASMVGPDNVQYHWQDEKGKKVKQSAPQYIDHMMSYVQKSVTDESIFPTKFGQKFPPGFADTVRKIHRYLLHVLAHVYHSHYNLVVMVTLHGHLNTLFSHFMAFSIHFQLLQDKETEVLMDLHNALLKAMEDAAQRSANPNSDQTSCPDSDQTSPPDSDQASRMDSVQPPHSDSNQLPSSDSCQLSLHSQSDKISPSDEHPALSDQQPIFDQQPAACNQDPTPSDPQYASMDRTLVSDSKTVGACENTSSSSQTKHSADVEKNGVASQFVNLGERDVDTKGSDSSRGSGSENGVVSGAHISST